MKQLIFSVFSIIFLILFFPQIHGQTESYDEVSQKSVKITIDLDGTMQVTHQIRDSNEPKKLKFVDGTVSNLKITDRFAQSELIEINEEEDSYVILPNQGELFVQYSIDDAVVFKDGFWTLDFLYLESTTFFVPEEVDLIFTNERPVFLDEKKGFTCHGCQLLLQYSIDEPKNIMEIILEEDKFYVEIRTFSQIENFNFDQSKGKISFDVNNESQFLATVIPTELLWGPYIMYLDEEKIPFQEYINNGTHVWLNTKHESSGQIEILGNTIAVEDTSMQTTEIITIAIVVITVGVVAAIIVIRKFSRH